MASLAAPLTLSAVLPIGTLLLEGETSRNKFGKDQMFLRWLLCDAGSAIFCGGWNEPKAIV
jgi:hypothetical protein